ncbi:unnamed protein product [Cochlearia groenlandica]
MDFPRKSLKVTIPVKSPIKKEEDQEDGFTTPKGDKFRIPPQIECPPAPGPRIHRKTIQKRRKKLTGRRLITVNFQDLDIAFARKHTYNIVSEDS